MRGAKWGWIAVMCLAVAGPGCNGCAKPPPVSLEVPAKSEPIVFPLEDDGWLDREPLPAAVAATNDDARVIDPSVDKEGRIQVTGQTITLAFSDELFDDATIARAPLVGVTPAAPGRTKWTSGREVEFRADKPFDPDVDYTLTLPEIVGRKGKTLRAFKATFRAIPEVKIAGKIIHYNPKPGEPRPIHVRPWGDTETPVGPTQELLVLYDQPVDLAFATGHLTLADDKNRKLPLTLSQPPPGDTFEGEKVDTRSLVRARMASAPLPGAKLVFTALPAKVAEDGAGGITRELHVAPLPKLTGVSCYETDKCVVTGTTLRGPATTGVTARFTNRVHHDDLDKHVRVTPLPPGLRVGGWGEDLDVHAQWAPGVTYEIRAAGATDRFGYVLPDVSMTFVVAPRTANAVLREGVIVLDETAAHDFFVTTRNVKRGELVVWNVPPGADALGAAVENARTNDTPTAFGAPRVIAFDGLGTTPHTYVRSPLDLWGKLEPGHAYLAQVRVKETSAGAAIAPDTGMTKASVPLFLVAGKDTVGAHVHRVERKAIVSVFRLATGEPVAGASVGLGSARSPTDDKGIAVLDAPKSSDAGEVTIKVGSEETVLPLDKITSGASDFYPELTAGEGDAAREREMVGVLVTDRGIYRPGSTLFVKGLVRKPDDKRIAAVPQARVRLRVTDASGSDIVDEPMLTSLAGTVTKEVALPSTGRTGRHRIRLEVDDAQHSVLAEETVRVAEFETPRFKVDLETPADVPDGHWRSHVVGRYFFGAPMDGGHLEWTLKKKLKKLEAKKLEDAGFSFGKERNPFDASTPTVEERPRTGEGKLRPDGTFDVDVELGPLADGPTEVTFEADVSDSSYRHVAAKKSVMRYPFPHYAGVRLSRSFAEIGPVKIDLVAVDEKGKPVAGVPLEARMERLEWKKSSAKAESGALVESWGNAQVLEGTCSVTSDAAPRSCEIGAKHWGDYRITVRADGHDSAVASFYAWGGEGYSWGEGGGSPAVPSTGKKIPISADKKSYAPGDTAKVLVQSPFPEAVALLTVERGALLTHEVRRFKGPSVVLDVPLTLAHAPYAHAVVTLLPIGGPESVYRIGVVRLPVSLDAARLAVHVTSAKRSYDIRETAEIAVEVRRSNGELVKNADVTLAVVDEGVLRLTDFHAKDPTPALHPPRPLEFSAADSRQLLFRRHEKAHVAGGGDAEGSDSVDTRRKFVETAAWLPDLVTDASGRASAHVQLPDNLTEFRMMATVVGEDGAAGANEESFVVTRPFLLEPILPSFALKGDRLEIAAMAHNNTDAAVNAKVRIMDQLKTVRIAAHGHERVAVPFVAAKTTTMELALDIDGKTRDRVEKTVRVELPGNEEHPQASGVFLSQQEITLAVPPDAVFEDNAQLVLRTGSALYPELGQRLAFLTAYPHGCVEQTTSGTLPLLAARSLLPWTGVEGLSDEELRKRIAYGVSRLGTMKTVSGGLAYWPGGTLPHLYGTVYATRALLRAKELGIEEPGLLPDALKFLSERLAHERDGVLKVSIAEVLAQAGVLEEDATDSLWDARRDLDGYGLASLALALSIFPKQAEHVQAILDLLESAFDGEGMVKATHGQRDYAYWGSSDRDRAQALIAMARLRPTSKLTGILAHRLLRNLEVRTTQSSAWSLIALASFMGEGKPNGGVDVKIRAEGVIFDTTRRLGGDNKEVVFPLASLRGKKIHLVLEGDGKAPCAFAIEARYLRPDASSRRHARRSALGPSVYRVFTDPMGNPIDLAKVKAGDVVRVALRVDMPKLDTWRASYLAITDRFAAGFQPVQPDLATVASVPDLQKTHPFYDGLTSWGGSASHVDVRDDRVNLYFDSVYGSRSVYASYLLRATTPGEFVLPSARAELMYEPGSEGYSESGRVAVR